MAKSIKVIIGGENYSVIGDNEDIVMEAAENVDSKIREIKAKNDKLPITTTAVLAALNIAEQSSFIRRRSESEKKYLINEISRMTAFLNESIKLAEQD
ncbi:MAG: cell division protein ZapA [Candidatus Kapaibacterium sp.]